MKECIEEIVEIILEDVSCNHDIEEPSSDGPGYDDVTFALNDEKAVVEKCLKIIMMNKPGITAEFIEKKAIKLHKAVYGSLMKCDFKCHMMMKFRNQVRALFEEESCSGK